MGWSFISNLGGESYKDFFLQCQNIFLISRDFFRGVFYFFDCILFLLDILYCLCNKN